MRTTIAAAPADFGKMMVEETEKWAKVVAASGASAARYFCIGAGASVVWMDPDRDLVAVVRWIDGAQIDGFCQRVSAAVPVKSVMSAESV
jgi:cystathionine beta-lyase family protein involved in aluminum resistance